LPGLPQQPHLGLRPTKTQSRAPQRIRPLEVEHGPALTGRAIGRERVIVLVQRAEVSRRIIDWMIAHQPFEFICERAQYSCRLSRPILS
jgi:hypothetical protein